MTPLQDWRDKIGGTMEERLRKLEKRLQIKKKKLEIEKLEKESARTGFWENHEAAAKKMKRLSDLHKAVEKFAWLQELMNEGEVEKVEKELVALEEKTYLSGPYADSNAILSIHAGQGGTEAMDWTQMLYRMYTKYAESKGWKWEEVDKRAGEEAGLKNVTITVNGDYAYGHLAAERGVHRLVRQSPFNADKLRQTSFALVEVLPVVEENNEIKIEEDELEWSFFCSSGPGGQNVNKVATAVRLKHKPSGIVVGSQSQRSQHQNRETALNILRSKLWDIQEQKERKKEKKLKGEYKQPGWGNQIRSYVLHPYKMVKDLRTGAETSQTDKVLAGNIDLFIDAYLKRAQDV